MTEGLVDKPASEQAGPDKTGSTAARRSLKAVSSILKSLGSVNNKKSQSIKLETAKVVLSDKSTLSLQTEQESQAPQTRKPVSKSSSSIKSRDSPDLDKKNSEKNTTDDQDDASQREKIISIADGGAGGFQPMRMRPTKFMKKYPELFRDDVSINPSYTGLLNYPYNVVCRQRFHKNKLRINRQLKKEIDSITMMQTLALDGVRVGRIFTIGFPASATIVPDFATPKERQHINEMLSDR